MDVSAQKVIVTDKGGVTLPGVEVFSEDLSYGEVTDRNGQVDLNGISSDLVIKFRFLGYGEVETTAGEISKQNNVVVMILSNQIIEEVVVLGRKSVAQSELPFQIKTINIEDIRATNTQTSADALSHHGGVFVQKSQMGGGSPIIRGFEANRVLLVVDGIRLNNAIYRSGHLQNAVTVDQAMLERMEVIFGPNSLIYGSDALGGVVNFKTRSPQLSESPNKLVTEAQYYARYASANNEKSLHFDYSAGKSKWGSLTSLTFSDFGNLRTGSKRDPDFPEYGKRLIYQGISNDGSDIVIDNDNPNIQIGTNYNQVDFLQKFLFTPDTENRISANIQYSFGSNVPRYDNLSEIKDGKLRYAEWNYGPQKRFLAALDYRNIQKTAFYDQAILIGAYQRIDEDRISRIFEQTIRNTEEEDVSVYSLTLDLSKYLTANNFWSLDYGADIQHNTVESNAYDQDINTSSIFPSVLSRYASGANRLTNIGAYFFVKGKSKNEAYNLSAGVRYANSSYFLSYERDDPVDWPSEFYDGISGSNQSVTGSIGGTWLLTDKWQIRSIISSAFRSPNIDDLSKIRVNGGEITFPNINLKPERSKNFEITLASHDHKFLDIGLTGYYTQLSDAIVRRPFNGPNGQNMWVSNGETLIIVGNQNIQQAEIYGLSTQIFGSISTSLKWNGSFNLTKGKEVDHNGEKSPLAHIPPTYGKIELNYQQGPWKVKANHRFNSAKLLSEYGGSADNPELATANGSLAWSTLNIYTSYAYKNIEISLALENLFDKHYRLFASGVSAPGRNLILSLRGSF